SRDDSEAAQVAASEAGASAFVHKSRSADEVIETIRLVAQGQNLITPRTIATLLNKRKTMSVQLQSLTPRERDVLRRVAAGVSSPDIARELGISYTTVRTHIRGLGRKHGVHSQREAPAQARQLGLLDAQAHGPR